MGKPRIGRRWRYASVLLVIILALGAIAYTRGRAPRPAPTIHDSAFVAAANRLCRATIPRLRATKDTVRSEDSREAETAAAIDRASAGIDALVSRMRALEVRAEDRDRVVEWFAAWDRYTAAGRRYARSIRGGDPLEYGRVDDQSVRPLKAISHFSYANRIDACIP